MARSIIRQQRHIGSCKGAIADVMCHLARLAGMVELYEQLERRYNYKRNTNYSSQTFQMCIYLFGWCSNLEASKWIMTVW